MKKITKQNLEILANTMPVISESEMREIIGGSGYYSSGNTPSGYIYSTSEFDSLVNSNSWEGGYVGDNKYSTYVSGMTSWGPELIVTGSITSDESHTGDWMNCPKCMHSEAGGLKYQFGELGYTMGTMIRCIIMNFLNK